MNNKMIIILSAAALPLSACTGMYQDRTLGYAGTGAVVGAAAGTGISAIAGGNLLTGAVIGAAVGGIAGALWADRDGDGRTDGYTRNGTYYEGTPAGYDPNAMPASERNCRSVGNTALTGAAVGGVAGAGVGAVTDSVSVFEGAAVGAVVGGLAGAIWADSNNDGCVDGYNREGRYYSGAPMVQPTSYRSGERG